MRRALRSVLVLSLLVSSLAAAEERVVLSKVYPIVRKYKSMEGLYGSQTVYLGDPDHPELVWLTAIRTEVVGEDGRTKKSPELMCHMNVDIDPVRHRMLFNLKRFPASRLMTISQGMRIAGGAFEARLPEGFAFPIASSEPLLIMTQVLNHNIEHPKNLKVRHKVTFEYVRDRDLKTRPIALFNLGVSGMVQMGDNALALTSGTGGSDHGPSCLIGMRAPNAMGMSSDYVDPQGRHMTGHWIVPPGRQVNASDVTWFLNLPYDTKLHYAAVHLHPYAQSLTLRDMTAGVDVFKARATNPKRRVGLEHVDALVSVDGVPLYKDHHYEMISVYDNPTKQNADSMASMFLGVADPEFVAPTPEQLVARATTLEDAVAAVLRTSAGDVGMMLLRGENPQVVLQFARLLRSGAFDTAEAAVTETAITFGAPLRDDIRALLQPVAERNVPPRPGSVALCMTDQEISVSIVTRLSPALAGHCSVVGQIGPGSEVLRVITAERSGRLLHTDVLNDFDLRNVRLAPAKTVASR